jgi:putative ATPase
MIAVDLFETAFQNNDRAGRPLADRLRPKSLEEFVGQQRSLKSLQPYLKANSQIPNLILWGPPGTGKTTLAHLLAQHLDAEVHVVNATDTGAKQIRELGQEAHVKRLHENRQTLLFIDEIHRLNRSQQDVLLPFTENGDFVLIGATTENPSYELNSALLSRCRVIVLEQLTSKDLEEILQRAWANLELDGAQVLTDEARQAVLEWADGDARRLLNAIETVAQHWQAQDLTLPGKVPFDRERLSEVLQSPHLRYDKTGAEHYDTISAFIKSVRGSDPDAAIYYLARMLEGGEDPVFIARRLVILASEDVGNADPRAITVAVAGLQAVELIGMPEARINLAQVTTYMASAPKSNASYVAINRAQELVKETGTLPVPLPLRSASTALSKSLGYGRDYKYAHDGERGWLEMEFLPKELKDTVFYEPVDRGFEKNIREYLAWMKGKGKA